MVRRTFLFLLFLGIGIALFVSLIFQTGFDAIAESLSKFSLVSFLILLVLSLMNFALFTLRWDIIIRHYNKDNKEIHIPFYRLFLHRMSAFTVSYLTPSATSGGEPVRIFFLSEEGMSGKDAVSTVVIDKVFEYTALILFIFSGVVISMVNGALFPGSMEAILAITLIICGGIIFWFYYSTMRRIGFFSSIFKFTRLDKIKKIKNWEKSIIHLEEKMTHFYTQNMKRFSILMIISIATVLFMVFEHFLVAKFMGVNLTFLQSFLSATIPGISYILPVPGAIGALEGSHSVIFTLLGVSINAFVFVFILRLRDLVFVIIGLIHASKHGMQMIYKTLRNSSKKTKRT
ncbi:flippase-like domain-containing protein [Patescibacteria group bacterium]|nr:flippase-like domain-containing protein [Patescibacteria group bacterium]